MNKYIKIITNYFGDTKEKIIPITDENIILIDWFKRINSIEDNNKEIIKKKAIERSRNDQPCYSESIQNIYAYWNSKDIIVHRCLTESIAKAVAKALKSYNEVEICAYIDRYNTILKDGAYFFNYKWTLGDFLTRKDGISSFTDDGSKWINYVAKSKGKTAKTISTGYKII